MKYVILSDSDNVEPFIEPRQLAVVNGEKLVERTIRLLKENKIKDIVITSHDKRFNNLGAIRYEPKYNDYKPKERKGYWLNAFPKELLDEPVTFLFGDVYYSDEAIKTIVNAKTDSTLFFCSDEKQGYDKRYIKHHDEPFGYKVIDYETFKKHIEIVKDLYDKGLTGRHPVVWELYRSINGISVNEHKLTDNYIAINDETCDVDRVEDILLLELKVGGNKMIKVEVIKKFTLEKFSELKNIVRKNIEKNKEGYLYIGDTFECTKEMADYLMGNNRLNETFIKVLEIIPENITEKEVIIEEENIIPEEDTKELKQDEVIDVKAEKVTVKKNTKKTTTRKKK